MTSDNYQIVIVGASGDLAQRKLLPALFALFARGLLPPQFNIFGFARTAMTDAEFRARTAQRLTCRYTPGKNECAALTDQFLARCHYVAGQYDRRDSYLDLAEAERRVCGAIGGNRLFYFAIPPSLYLEVAHALAGTGLVACEETQGWTRVVLEKPFGHDRASSDRLVSGLGDVFRDEQTYRIDHYLGKEIIQNMLVLRFANRIFEPLWNSEFIRDVRIVWKETLDVGSRGGYFDGYGIIRDVMQNHLMQMLALTAMERPARLAAQPVRDEKVRVLRKIPALHLDDLVVGQYAAPAGPSEVRHAYREEEGVPGTSRTPTYAAALLRIHSPRWEGVPFFLECGKALDEPLAEIRIRFRDDPANLFGNTVANELILRVQPDEAVLFRIVNKLPGLAMRLEPTDLDLHYRTAFQDVIPDAYEALLLDVLEGDKSLFIRADELAAAWDIFDPVLHELEAQRVEPEPYAYGSRGPAGRARLLQRL